MATKKQVDPYDLSEPELIRKAAAVTTKYCSTSDKKQIGIATRKYAKCLDEIRARGPEKDVDLISFKLGFLARGVLDAERHIAQSEKGGHNRSGSPNRNYTYFRTRYQEDVEKEMDEHGILYTPACEKVAKHRGVTGRTVQKHTDRKKAIANVARRAKPK